MKIVLFCINLFLNNFHIVVLLFGIIRALCRPDVSQRLFILGKDWRQKQKSLNTSKSILTTFYNVMGE